MRPLHCIPAVLLALAGCAAQPRAVGGEKSVRYNPALLPNSLALAVAEQSVRLTPAWHVVRVSGADVVAQCDEAKWPEQLRKDLAQTARKPVLFADSVILHCADGGISLTPADSLAAAAAPQAECMASSPVYERELKTLRIRIIRALGPSFVPDEPAK